MARPEVSGVIDKENVARAMLRAALLRKLRHPVMPVVAGEDMTDGAERKAIPGKVAILQDGRVLNWDAALTAALAS